jgi:hypothetical protein
MFGFRNRFLAASSLSPTGDWQLTAPAGPARLPTRNTHVWRMSATLACLLGLPVTAHADFTFSAPNLAPGSPYRLIFVTSEETLATSTSISTYNAFVTSVAGNSPTLPTTTWTAIASTESESAVANISSVCSGACLTAPIYLVDGATVIAMNQSLFFSGTILNAIDEDESGNTPSGQYVWTGSTSSGLVNTGVALGDTDAEVGNASITTGGNYMDIGFPFNANTGFTQSDSSLPLYAISGELTVPERKTSTPEPMSGSLLLVGGIATGLVRRLRRKRQPAA